MLACGEWRARIITCYCIVNKAERNDIGDIMSNSSVTFADSVQNKNNNDNIIIIEIENNQGSKNLLESHVLLHICAKTWTSLWKLHVNFLTALFISIFGIASCL